MAIFGSDFSGGSMVADVLPLPKTLGDVTVSFDGIGAPLFAVTPGQIVAQLPARISSESATVVVVNEKGSSEARTLATHPFSPAVFTLDQNGSGQGVVVFVSGGNLAAPAGLTGNSRPAREGDLLTLFATGLGPVTPPVTDGQNSCDPDGVCLPDFSNLVLRRTSEQPIVTVGGVRVAPKDVLFSHLAPLFVGVYQVNFRMPAVFSPETPCRCW